jgi:hypothetical protein
LNEFCSQHNNNSNAPQQHAPAANNTASRADGAPLDVSNDAGTTIGAVVDDDIVVLSSFIAFGIGVGGNVGIIGAKKKNSCSETRKPQHKKAPIYVYVMLRLVWHNYSTHQLMANTCAMCLKLQIHADNALQSVLP